jgi:chromatin remodeling complex protein RSC6
MSAKSSNSKLSNSSVNTSSVTTSVATSVATSEATLAATSAAAKPKRVKKTKASASTTDTAPKVTDTDAPKVTATKVTATKVTTATTAATTTDTATDTATDAATDADTVETGSIESIESEFLSLATRLQELKTLQISVVSDLKKLHKTVHRHMKENSKKHKKRKNLDPNRPKRAPSGFAKPALISVELCNFLKKPEGTEMARTEVTKYLTQYIKEHKLQDEANRRKILPDKPLQQLLNVGQGDEVTYFNLQKYMKVHFPKSAVLSVSL